MSQEDPKNIDALKGIPPQDAVLFVLCTDKQEWHIAFDYKFMGRWVLISTTGKLIERSDVAFLQRCESLREDEKPTKGKRKRKDECLFCGSRSCYDRIVSADDGKTYDEIACREHSLDLYKHYRETAPLVLKYFISSTGKLKRGEPFNPHS